MVPRQKIDYEDDAVVIYSVVYENEGFEESAKNLLKLLQNAQSLSPGKKRKLYLDIEGHRAKEGGYDTDVLELQREVLLGFLKPYLSEIRSPLGHTANSRQQDDLPPALVLPDRRNEEK